MIKKTLDLNENIDCISADQADNAISAQSQSKLFALALGQLDQAILLEDAQGKVSFISDRCCDLLGLVAPSQQWCNIKRDQFFSQALSSHHSQQLSAIAQPLETSSSLTRKVALLLDDGRLLTSDCCPLLDSGIQCGILWSFNITNSQITPALVHSEENRTGVSRVFDRRSFEALTAVALTQPEEHALLYIDVDKFKRINYTAGHLVGDRILSDIKNILGSTLSSDHIVAHITSDEFAVLVKGDLATAKQAAQSLRDAVDCYRYQSDDISYHGSISIGLVDHISMQPDTSKLLAQADVVCDEAKKLGSGQIRIHHLEDVLLQKKQQEQRIISAIRHAIKHNKFQLFAQKLIALQVPQVDQGLHIEVLLRLQDEQGTLISPDNFIPLAESIGLMVHIDRWVIEHTFKFLASNTSFLNSVAVCAINLSGQSLMQADLAAFIRAQLSESGVPAHKICFEITETAAVSQLPQAEQFILALKEAGCIFALDDFGAGQSSFRYLKGLPVNYLKIDGAFIRNIDQDKNDPTDEALVRGMHEIAKALKIGTVAEYVERKETSELLQNIGIDYAQGWYYHKAEPIENLLNSK